MKMTEEEVQVFREELSTENTDQLKTIYLTFKEDILNFLRVKYPNNYQNAEDIYTDALIVLNNNILSGKISHFTSVKNYLIGICNNLHRQNNHLKNNFEKKLEDIRLHFSLFNDNVTEDIELKEHMYSICNEAMQTLSEKCQKIITYFYLHQMKMKEIAVKLELASADVAKTQKSRCFKSLKNKVSDLMKSKL